MRVVEKKEGGGAGGDLNKKRQQLAERMHFQLSSFAEKFSAMKRMKSPPR